MYDVIVQILNQYILVVMGIIYAGLNVWRMRLKLSVSPPIPIRVVKIGAGLMVSFYYIAVMLDIDHGDHVVVTAISRMAFFMLMLGDIATHAWVMYRVKIEGIGG